MGADVRRIIGVQLCLIGVVGISAARGDWRYLGQARPGGEAKLFAPEIMGHTKRPSFLGRNRRFCCKNPGEEFMRVRHSA